MKTKHRKLIILLIAAAGFAAALPASARVPRPPVWVGPPIPVSGS